MGRLGRSDWLTIGLKALREGAPSAIRLEAITEKAGKTRGSFYHHFKTHDAFVGGMFALWRETFTDDLMKSADAAQDPADRGASLNKMAAALDHHLEQALRQLAAKNPDWLAVVQEVDAVRIGYLRSLQADPGSDTAAEYARIEYAVFVGMQVIDPDLKPDAAIRIGALTRAMIDAHWNE